MVGDTAFASIQKNEEQYTDLARRVWENPEPAFRESMASRSCAQLLKEHGFCIEWNIGGIPTAFRASYGSDGPVIGLLGEYDALPGQSQNAVPYQSPIKDQAYGHGCGHNLLCAALAAAAVAVRDELEAEHKRGTIVFYGCPAEEILVGKGKMAAGGAFRELDAALAWHPGRYNRVAENVSTGVNGTKFHFKGVTAHAACDPEKGRSALDAVELMNVGINYLREHVPTDVRLHYVITEGGTAPNIVPDHATVWYYDRALSRETMLATEERMRSVAQGAAMMTGTELEIEKMGGCYPTLSNTVLVRLVDECMRAAQAPVWTEEEIEYAKKINDTIPEIWKESVRYSGAKQEDTQIFSGVMPPDHDNDYGSTDVGDVGHIVPTVFYKTACYNIGAPGHSWQVASCVGGSIGFKGMLYGARVTALAALRLMESPETVALAKEEFRRAMGEESYEPMMPDHKQF